MGTKLSMYDALKSIEPFSLSFHDDADGVYSASLLMLAFKLKSLDSEGENRLMVTSPPFNEYDTDVSVDLGFPVNPMFLKRETTGVIVDHHPDYPEIPNKNIRVYHDLCPTGLIIFKHLKDYLPKNQWWRVAGSLVGDGSTEQIPDEIWEAFPELLDEKGTLYRDNRWQVQMSKYPVYSYLSSGVNAMCRIGNPMGALKMCMEWRTPIEAVISKEAQEAKDLLRIEENNILKNKPIAEIIKNRFAVVRIMTTGNFGMSGAIASSLASSYRNYTLIVINEKNGETSIRGVLAKYISNKLKAAGYKTGGHPGFCGATVPPEEIEMFIETIRKA